MPKKPVRVFLDSNVILSGLISDTGAPRLILDVLSMDIPGLVAVTGRFNIVEIERNIRKKAPKVLPVYHEYFPKLGIELVPMPSQTDVERRRGIIADKDTPVLVSAINGKADFLVTGDKKHFQKVRKADLSPLRIVSPSEFLEILASLLKEERA
jgi:putative PIN family toxin of toxin-antitoxin system